MTDMKLMVILEIESQSVVVETMQRNGFSLVKDGSSFKIQIANSVIPQGKIHTVFIEHPTIPLSKILDDFNQELEKQKLSDASSSTSHLPTPYQPDARQQLSDAILNEKFE